MNRKKLQRGFFVVLEIAVMLAIAFASGYLLLCYCNYGESAVSENVREPETGEGSQTSPLSIRVRIMGNGFLSDVHPELILASREGFTVLHKKREGYELDKDDSLAGDKAMERTSELGEDTPRQSGQRNQENVTELQLMPEDLEESDVLVLEPSEGEAISVNTLKRADGIPEYYGRLYIWREEDGMALLNELPLETYLYSVVSSEMPSNYPLEAQKAQAVCARTYAVNCTGVAEEGALTEDVTDSVDFQVYNNYGMTEVSQQAVDETAGETLPLQDIQYYSTSCLSERRTDLDSDEAFAAFLAEKPEEGAEYDSRWLRWQAEVSKEELLGNIEAYMEQASPGEKTAAGEEEAAMEISVTAEKRRGDGQVQALRVSWGSQSFTVEGEYEIRKFLGSPQAQITLTDGSQIDGMQLLPSAFFCITQVTDSGNGLPKFLIQGGGYGHGNGMSQCGAAAMAEKGMDYKEIIGYYYSGMAET